MIEENRLFRMALGLAASMGSFYVDAQTLPLEPKLPVRVLQQGLTNKLQTQALSILRQIPPQRIAPPQVGTLDALIAQVSASETGLAITVGSGSTPSQVAFADFASFGSNAVSMFPGSVVDGNAGLIAQGNLKPIGLPLGNGTITIVNAPFASPNAMTTLPLTPASLSNYQTAYQQLSTQPFQAQSPGNPNFTYTQVSSSDEAKIAASASFSGYGQSVNAFFDSANSKTASHIMFSYQQIFFIATYQPNGSYRSSYFDPGVTLAQATSALVPGHPPLVVSSVAYGAAYYFMADSEANQQDASDAIKASVSGYGLSGSAGLTTHQLDVMNSMKIHVLAVGGRSSAVTSVLLGGPNIVNQLQSYIKAEGDISGAAAPQIIPMPLYYELRYLDGINAIAQVSNLTPTTNYKPTQITALNLTIQVTDNDKEKDTGIAISLLGADGTYLTSPPSLQLVPANTGQQQYYWNDNSKPQSFPISLIEPIPSYDLPGTQFIISAPGDSWHATLTITASGLNSDKTALTNQAVLPTTLSLFFNDGGNKSPYPSKNQSSYCFYLIQPTSSSSYSDGGQSVNVPPAQCDGTAPNPQSNSAH